MGKYLGQLAPAAESEQFVSTYTSSMQHTIYFVFKQQGYWYVAGEDAALSPPQLTKQAAFEIAHWRALYAQTRGYSTHIRMQPTSAN